MKATTDCLLLISPIDLIVDLVQNGPVPHEEVSEVLPLDMVENSSNLCKSSLGRCFRQWVVRTGHLTLE